MIPRQAKYLIKFYFKKEPVDFFEILRYSEKIKDIAISKRSEKKIANALLYYAKHTLKPEEFEFIKRKLKKEYNIRGIK